MTNAEQAVIDAAIAMNEHYDGSTIDDENDVSLRIAIYDAVNDLMDERREAADRSIPIIETAWDLPFGGLSRQTYQVVPQQELTAINRLLTELTEERDAANKRIYQLEQGNFTDKAVSVLASNVTNEIAARCSRRLDS